MTKPPVGDSRVQREVEGLLIQRLSSELNVKLKPKKLPLQDGAWVELDGFSESPPVLVEAWAHIGSPKSAQRDKVITDAFKLVHASRPFGSKCKKILLFSDEEAAKPFKGRGWMAQCLKADGIEVKVIELPELARRKVKQAQKEQYR